MPEGDENCAIPKRPEWHTWPCHNMRSSFGPIKKAKGLALPFFEGFRNQNELGPQAGQGRVGDAFAGGWLICDTPVLRKQGSNLEVVSCSLSFTVVRIVTAVSHFSGFPNKYRPKTTEVVAVCFDQGKTRGFVLVFWCP